MSKFYSVFASILLLLLVSCNETGVSASTTPEQTIADIAIEQDMTPQDAVDTLNARGCIASTSMTVSEFQNNNPGVLFELADGGYYYDFTKCGTVVNSSSITSSNATSSSNVSSSSSSSNVSSSVNTSSSSTTSSSNTSSSTTASIPATPNLFEISDAEWQTVAFPADTDAYLYNIYNSNSSVYVEGIKLTHLDNEMITWSAGDLITYNYTNGLISINKDIMYDAPGGETLDSTHTRLEWTCYSKIKPYISNGDGNDSITIYLIQTTPDSLNTGSIEILMDQDVSKEFVFKTRIFNSDADGKQNYTYKYTFAINDMLSTGIPDSVTTSAEATALGYPTTLSAFYNGRTIDSFTIRFTSGTVNQLGLQITAIKLH